MSKIEIVNNTYTVEPLYQWDKNQDIEIYGLSLPYVPEIHFTNSTMDRAIVRQASMNGAGVITAHVPNSLLQKPYKITAYVCTYEGETFRSLYAIEIPVKARNKPGDYTLENDEEIYSFNALENQVVNALVEVEKAKVAYNTAEELLKTTLATIGNTVDNHVAEAIAELLDTTLTLSGKAADAKAVGDVIAEINETLGTHRDDIDDLQDDILTRAKFASGSYVGTGTYGEANPTSIPVPFKPKLMIIVSGLDLTPNIYIESWFTSEYVYSSAQGIHTKYENSTIFMYGVGTDNRVQEQYNVEGTTYHWYIFA